MAAVGSAVTYARRYLLQAMASLAAEDDDGNEASKAEPMSDRQANDILDGFAQLEFDDKKKEAGVKWASNGRTTDFAKLTMSEAEDLIEDLNRRAKEAEEKEAA